jgi:hypothetical protein
MQINLHLQKILIHKTASYALINSILLSNKIGCYLTLCNRKLKMKKHLFTTLAISTLLSVNFNASAAALACASGVPTLLASPTYKTLNTNLTATDLVSFKTALQVISNDAQYQVILDLANSIATRIGTTGRVTVTLPDGTLVVDTKKGASNTFANFTAKTIGENLNTRVAVLDAQLWPCGIGVEVKYSTVTGTTETYVARRVGSYLNNFGTVRISQ